MKKLMLLVVFLLATGIFAADWYTKQELVTDLKTHSASKDTTWNTYVVGTQGYIWNPITRERGTFYDVSDFGLSYPINIHAASFYVTSGDTAAYEYSVKIYAKDGSTLLWQSPIHTSQAGVDNDVYLDTPIMVSDDFWVSVVPNSTGYPRVFSGIELGADPASTHTYLKGNDGSWNPFTDGTDYYEMFAYVLLEPFAGTDTLAPIIRDISGTEVFMERDMDLSITLHEQNTVVSPMQAQYNVGAGWVDFEMTQLVKDAYTFTGTLPGQAGGTAGQVKFLLADDQANSVWSSEYPIFWSKDLPMFEEGFEGDIFPPAGWTLQSAGAGWIRVDQSTSYVPVYNGSYGAAHLDDQGAQDDWLITPAINLPSENSCTFSFWQNAFFVEFLTYNEVCVSTDMVNWTTIYVPPFDPVNWELTENIWQEVTLTLGNWVGQTIYIGFHYQGDFSNQWYIDDAKLIFDYQGPQIASISGNSALLPDIGAYLNNPMTINLDITDRSGIKSVVGHYDIGGDAGDIVFSNSKEVAELWTASIPAQSSEAAGTISFTLTDIGDVINNTGDFPIFFVQDSGVPVIKYLINNETFIGLDMNLELSFYDESAIASCKGFYSKDDYVNTYEFDLTPSKIHEYAYTGTIPAESEEVFFNGKVYFKIMDTAGNELTTEMHSVKWLDGQIEFFEDFEGDLSNWTVDGKWGIEEEPSISGTHSLTESVNSLYSPTVLTSARWATPMDWTLVMSASISFWVKYDIEPGFDYMYFEISKDGGANWIRLKSWDGIGIGWNKVQIPMDAGAGNSQVTFRFAFKPDALLNLNGMYIDDIELKSYNKDYAFPTIVGDPYKPEFYQGALNGYTDSVQITDKSGVGPVMVYYTSSYWSDGTSEEMSVPAVNTTDDWYEFTIPQQEAGRTIRYKFWAQDTSIYQNEGYSPEYVYIAGEHTVYEAGVVSYYTTTDAGDAKAVRISLPDGMTETTIAYALIRTYQDSDNISAPIKFHLWDDNGGVPGTDLIEPFIIYSESSVAIPDPMTRVDLRDKAYNVPLTGDFWIGFEATNGIVYTTGEATSGYDDVGDFLYERSFDGSSTGVGMWAWSMNGPANYHMRAVLGEYTGIEDEVTPVSTSLEQNYPNPFNPTTTINFNLAKDSKVSLVVYDVMGREVANLVNKDMVSGSHKVSFDASRLVSGVYYYNLKAGNVNQTKKMMLIK